MNGLAGVRRLAGASLGWAACMCLGACGLLPAREPGAPADTARPVVPAALTASAPAVAEAPPGAASAAVATPVDAAAAPAGEAAGTSVSQTYRLEVDAPRDLRTLLQTYLDLARFQTAAHADTITPSELGRLANAAPVQARALLETEGYFSSEVTVSRGTTPEDLPLIRITVVPGPRSVVTGLDLRAEGPLKQRIDAGDKEAQALFAELTQKWSLPAGQPFRQAAWNGAKNGALAALRAEGFPKAVWVSTEARVDARAHTVGLAGVVNSGPQFLIGDLEIEGLERYDEAAVRNVSKLMRGSPYSEKRLLEYQDRLLKLGLFETVSVEIDAEAAHPEAAPVRVRVREQTFQQATTGFGFSDKTGLRATLEHRHRRPFGWDGQVYNKFELGSKLRSWEGELISNPDRRGYRKLLATSLSWLDSAGEITEASRVRAGRSLDTQHIERLVFAEYLDSTLKKINGVEESTRAVSANYHWVWRELDSVVLPTKGISSSVQAGVGYATSNFASNGGFTRLYTRDTFYWPLGNNWFSQWRIEAGQVFAANRVGIPDPLLFRAGGDESVRGYGYRTLGPIKDNIVTSGRTLFTTSFEVAHPFTNRLPSLWWAAFADAGNSAQTWREIRPALGYGLGLRYRSPVGPLRLDLAYGQEVRKVRLHLSVGIAF